MGKALLHSVMRTTVGTAGKSSERKKLLKMCVRKLQSIEDPETFLCRSVLINNTLKTLRTMQREAKLRKEALRRRVMIADEMVKERNYKKFVDLLSVFLSCSILVIKI